MTTTAELVAALKVGRTWQSIADALTPAHPRSYWAGVASGRFEPPLAERNAVRLALSLDPLPTPPADVVRASGVEYVISTHDAPDLALLVRTDGAIPDAVRIRTNGKRFSDGTYGDSCRVTCVTSPATQRRARRAPIVPTLDNIGPVAPERIGRGKSGNAVAIARTARLAAAEMEV